MTVIDNDPVPLPITLQSDSSTAIVVTGVKIKILTKTPPPIKGTVILPDGCGGLMSPRSFNVNLDDLQPEAQPAPGKDSATAPADFPMKVSADDPEQVVLNVATVRHHVRFAVIVEWVSGGEAGSKTLDNDGQGYELTGPGDLRQLPVTQLPEQ